MIFFSYNKTLSHNPIYSIHSSYYSFVISLLLGLVVLTIYFSFCPFIINKSFYNKKITILLPWSLIFAWINDPWIESYLSITRIEQYSMVIGIKLPLMSEFMLSFSLFWLLINFRFVSNTSSIFIPSPLLSSYSLSIARSNALIPQLPSPPIQPTQLYIKSADLIHAIETIGQGIFRSIISIILQFSEMLYSYYPLSPNIIGSIFYLTTGSHGLHVIIGSFAFFVLLLVLLRNLMQ